MNTTDSVIITVEGIDDVVAGFDAIAKRIQQSAMTEIASAVGKLVVEEAKANAPIAATATPKGHDPGTLKSRGIAYSIRFAAAGAREILIGFTKAGWYGIFLEFGTIHISPKPMILPAYETKKSEIISTMGNIAAKYVKGSES